MRCRRSAIFFRFRCKRDGSSIAAAEVTGHTDARARGGPNERTHSMHMRGDFWAYTACVVVHESLVCRALERVLPRRTTRMTSVAASRVHTCMDDKHGTHARTHTRMRAHTHRYTCTCMRACTHARMHACVHVCPRAQLMIGNRCLMCMYMC